MQVDTVNASSYASCTSMAVAMAQSERDRRLMNQQPQAAPLPPVGFVAIGKQLRVTVPAWIADQFEGAALSAIVTGLPGGELDVIIQKDANSGAHFGREVKGQKLLLITRDKVLGIGDLEFGVVECTQCQIHEGRKLMIRVPAQRKPLVAKAPRKPKPAPVVGSPQITIDAFRDAIRVVNDFLAAHSSEFDVSVHDNRVTAQRTEVFE